MQKWTHFEWAKPTQCGNILRGLNLHNVDMLHPSVYVWTATKFEVSVGVTTSGTLIKLNS